MSDGFPDPINNFDPAFDPVDDKSPMGTSEGNLYWAAQDPDQLTSTLTDIVKGYYDRLTRYGLHYLWRRAYFTYYGIDFNIGQNHGTSSITFGGAQGELSFLKVNHYRSLMQNILNMTTSQLPRWEPRAVNSDVQSAEQTAVARGVLDYEMRDGNLDMIFRDVVERALIYGEGFCWVNWDLNGGEEVRREDGSTGQSGIPARMPRIPSGISSARPRISMTWLPSTPSTTTD
jgi:hypothetical protein